MKIDQNLRVAIRSLCSTAARRSALTWQQQRDRDDKAVRTLLEATPQGRKWLETLPKKQEKIEALRGQANTLEEAIYQPIKILGARMSHDSHLCINDHEAFAKAGGKIEVKTSRSAEQIIAQLATATEAEGKQILKDLGIVWD